MELNNAASRVTRIITEANKCGVNINYSPEVVFDTSAVSNQVWEKSMKNGIGSSSAGQIMGVSRFGNAICLILEKQGILPEEKMTAEKQFMFDFGHALEDPMLRFFSAKTGFKVFIDRNRYRHPVYPFLFADLDAVCIDQDGMKCVVECKSCSPVKLKDWKSGVFGADGVCPELSYIWQMVHHVSTLNVDRGYWIACATNNPSEIVIVRYDRDFEKEKVYLENASFVWNGYVTTGKLPDFAEIDNASFRLLKMNYLPERHIQEFGLLPQYEPLFMQYYVVTDHEKQIKEQYIGKLEEQRNALKLKIMESLHGNNCGKLETPTAVYSVSITERESDTIDLDMLKLKHPEIIDQLKEENIIRTVKSEPKLNIRRRQRK